MNVYNVSYIYVQHTDLNFKCFPLLFSWCIHNIFPLFYSFIQMQFIRMKICFSILKNRSVFPENIKWKQGVDSVKKTGPTIRHTFYVRTFSIFRILVFLFFFIVRSSDFFFLLILILSSTLFSLVPKHGTQ